MIRLRLEALEKKVKELEQTMVGGGIHMAKVETVSPSEMYQNERSPPSAKRPRSIASEPSPLTHEMVASAPIDVVRNISREDDQTLQSNTSRAREGLPADFVTSRLVTLEEAKLCFQAFFEGCYHFVPIFDPAYDSMDSMRNRSSICFSAIVLIGSRVVFSVNSPRYLRLKEKFQNMYSRLLIFPDNINLELVQAATLIACYLDNGWQQIGNALRLAMLAGMNRVTEDPQFTPQLLDSGWKVMGGARTWFFIYVMESVLSLGSGRVSRLRLNQSINLQLLLTSKHATATDARLLAQIELADIRSKYFQLLQQSEAGGESLIPILDEHQDVLDQWYHNWLPRMDVEFHRDSLSIQMQHALLFSRCVVLKSLLNGQSNQIPEEHKRILLQACENANRYLEYQVESESLSQKLPYAFDYTFATAAFSVVLLLKTSQLFPDKLHGLSLNNCNLLYDQMVKVLGEEHEYSRAVKKMLRDYEEAEQAYLVDELAADLSGALDWMNDGTYFGYDFAFDSTGKKDRFNAYKE